MPRTLSFRTVVVSCFSIFTLPGGITPKPQREPSSPGDGLLLRCVGPSRIPNPDGGVIEFLPAKECASMFVCLCAVMPYLFRQSHQSFANMYIFADGFKRWECPMMQYLQQRNWSQYPENWSGLDQSRKRRTMKVPCGTCDSKT